MSRRIFSQVLCVVGVTSLAVTSAYCQRNDNTTLPLHAVVGLITIEGELVPDPCDPVNITTSAQTGDQVTIYVIVRNYDDIVGVQTAFTWGDWQFLSGHWNCRPNQVVGHAPYGDGGSREGTLATAFDCIERGRTAIIGMMQFTVGTGCLRHTESSFPFGTHVLASDFNEVAHVYPFHRGEVCVGEAGYPACSPVMPTQAVELSSAQSPLFELTHSVECVTPVESRSWGTVKSVYRH
jgi:hypothetical protein